MKSSKRRKIRATIALCFLLLSIVFSLGAVFLSAGTSRLLSLGAVLCASASALLVVSVIVRLFGILNLLEAFSVRSNHADDSNIDLSRLVGASSLHGKYDSLSDLDSLLALVNDDIAALKRSAKKFDLFSSDILFSARNLADQAEKQLDMLLKLRTRAQSYFEGLSRTNAELGGLTVSVRENASGATVLRTRALESQTRMTEIIDGTGRAAKDAKRGAKTAAETTAAAELLAHGLRSLNSTAAREAEEARKIGESLRAIEDIVERTHVLATNASIEAARAGERGKGFAVIAAEVRSLAASSRESLDAIGGVLRSVAKGIDDSASLVNDVSAAAGNLEEAIAQSRVIFEAIDARVAEIERSIKTFNDVFSQQIQSAESVASAAGTAVDKINGFEEDYRLRSSDYQAIAAAVEETERGASEAQRAARFLAQLAGYLKVGGNERNRVLQRYEVDQHSEDRKFGRKARRETLLYNLEVRNAKGAPLGYLGDISATGLLLLSSEELRIGDTFPIKIALPLTTEGERTIDLTIRTRRSEKDIDGFRIGCSFENIDASARTRIDYLLKTLTMGAVIQDQDDAETLEEV